MKSITRFTVLPVVTGICIFLLFFITCTSKIAGSNNEEYFFSGNDTTTFTIWPDSLGLVIKDGKDESNLRKILSDEGYTLIRNIRGELFIAVSTKKKGISREEIFDLSRDLESKYNNTIQQAGYLAHPKKGDVPVVVTDELVIDFTDNTTKDQVSSFMNENEMELAMQNPFIKTQYLVRLKNNSKGDALQVSRSLAKNSELKYIHPNFVILKDYRAIPDDPLFSEQWHHRNTGDAGGTPDADIDTDLAWDFTFGNPATIIAVIDGGFDMTHPDITPNFSINTADMDADGIDDDGNGFIDDRIGWDFAGCAGLPCGDNTLEPDNHGTATIGTAAAKGRNTLGVAGSCPDCRVIPIKPDYTPFADALAFGYAQSRGAKIISCSWGYTLLPTTMVVVTAINNAVMAGVTVLFAMPNRDMPYCFAIEGDIASLPSVIAVSRSTNTDRCDLGGYGDCVDVLAPSAHCNTLSSGRGTLWAVTTDRQGPDGYNSASPGPDFCMCPSTEGADLDYTRCFSGTSFSTPLVAGVAGLILSADNTVTPLQVRYLLQDCADKIEPSAGQYSPVTGYSDPASGGAKHAFGRVNAFEAVRVAAPADIGGKAGIDIYFRDNIFDWGNTEQPSNVLFEPARSFIPHWESVDIKVDAPPFAATPPASGAAFDAFVDEHPLGGMTNKVYVRVHNRGYRSAASVNVKLHWVYAGMAFPLLPADFWTSFPADASDVSVWHPLGVQPITSLAYSGCSIAGSAADASQIAVFDFPAPVHDETLPNHYCLMALMDSPDDRLITPAISGQLNMDLVTPYTNNATHRNVTIENVSMRSSFSERFFMTNPFKYPISARIRISNPGKVAYKFDNPGVEQFITLKPNESKLIKLQLDAKGVKLNSELRVEQVRKQNNSEDVMGGITFKFVK
jgi:subtilisin family serine protease